MYIKGKKANQEIAHDRKPFCFKNTEKYKFNSIPKGFHWFWGSV